MNPDYDAAALLMINKFADDAPQDVKDVCQDILSSWLNTGIQDYARGRLEPVAALYKSGVAGILYPWHGAGVAA